MDIAVGVHRLDLFARAEAEAGLRLVAGSELAALLAAFKIAFYSRPRPLDPYRVPSGKQFQAVKGRMLELVGAIDALPFEPVSIVSHDGLRLSGRYYHLRDGAPLQINFHGYRGSALQDFCGGMTIARAAGRNVLLIDERAQGESEGRVISFGVNERRDCLQWAEYAVSRFGAETKIILSGVSMGAATVLMASELPLPANVKCIIADCPYSSPEAIIRTVCGAFGLFGVLAGNFLLVIVALFVYMGAGQERAEEQARTVLTT